MTGGRISEREELLRLTRTALIVQLLHDLPDNLTDRLHGLDILLGLPVIFLQVLDREPH